MSNTEERSEATPSAPAPASTVEPTQEVAGIALSMRIPQFWRDQPRLWFITFESATADMKRSQNQLAQMVIAQLEKQDIRQLTDLLYNPPAEKYYEAIKKRLIELYEESDSKQVRKLLAEQELGDEKPSQLLRRMRDLARNMFPEDTIRIMWSNALPPYIRSVIIVSESFKNQATLDELAALADKMAEETPQIAAIRTDAPPPLHVPPPLAPPPATISHSDGLLIMNELRRLSLEVAEIRAARQPQQTYDNSVI